MKAVRVYPFSLTFQSHLDASNHHLLQITAPVIWTPHDSPVEAIFQPFLGSIGHPILVLGLLG